MSTPVAPWLRGGSGSGQQPRPKPDSSYTEQVAQGGLPALQQARQQRRYGMGGADQNYRETGVFSYNAPVFRPNEAYSQWQAGMQPQQQQGPYAYGQYEDGNYAGFRTEGGLKAAVRGRAEQLRRTNDDVFGALDMLANQNLDALEGDYADAKQSGNRVLGDRADNSLWNTGWMDDMVAGQAQQLGVADPPARSSWGDVPGQINRMGDMVAGALADATGVRRPADAQAGMLSPEYAEALRSGDWAETEKVRTRNLFDTQKLQPWLAENAAPWLEQQDFAQAGLATPIATFAQAAGAEYGVDPMIVGGWYPEASALTDARDQRDLDFLEQTGMTASQYEQALAELERNQAAAANEQQSAAEEANQQAIDMYGYEATGQLATTGEISQRVGVPPMEVISILDSEAFQVYSADIETAMSSGDPETIGQAVEQVLADAAFTDPLLYQVLEVVYAPLVPSGFDVYGGQ